MTTPHRVGPLAQRLLKSIAKLRRQKVVDFATFSTGKYQALAAQTSVISTERLAKLHPLHARYVAVQHQVSFISDQLLGLPPLAGFLKIFTDAEGSYLPAGPPMSPLTASYFFYWVTFDAAVGIHQGYPLKAGQFGSRVRFTHHKHVGMWCVERTLRCPGLSGYPPLATHFKVGQFDPGSAGVPAGLFAGSADSWPEKPGLHFASSAPSRLHQLDMDNSIYGLCFQGWKQTDRW